MRNNNAELAIRIHGTFHPAVFNRFIVKVIELNIETASISGRMQSKKLLK